MNSLPRLDTKRRATRPKSPEPAKVPSLKDLNPGTFTVFPEEIWLEILAYIPRKMDLKNLCLTSRSLCRIARHLLFHTVRFDRGNIAKFYSFLQIVLSEAKYAKSVRSLHLQIWDYPRPRTAQETWDVLHDVSVAPLHRVQGPVSRPVSAGSTVSMAMGTQIRKTEPSRSVLEIMRRRVQGSRLPAQSEFDWILALASGSRDAEATLLLSHARYLETLSLIIPRSVRPRFLYGVMFYGSAKGASIRGQFPRLKALHADGQDEACALNIVVPLLDIPSMRTFVGTRLDERLMIKGLPESQGSLCITDIHIKSSVLSSNAIIQLIDSCKALNSFRVGFDDWSSPGYYARHGQGWPVKFSEIGEALERHRATLECLELDFSAVSSPVLRPTNSLYVALTTYIGSLADYARLRTVSLPQSALLELSESLPQSLETLSLMIGHWYSRHLRWTLVDLLQDVKERFPALRRIELDRIYGRSRPARREVWEELRRFEALQDDFCEAGISLVAQEFACCFLNPGPENMFVINLTSRSFSFQRVAMSN